MRFDVCPRRTMIDAHDQLVWIRRQKRCEITRLQCFAYDRRAGGVVLAGSLVLDLADRGQRTRVLAQVLKRFDERTNFGVAKIQDAVVVVDIVPASALFPADIVPAG
jgi:hypothetical protein